MGPDEGARVAYVAERFYRDGRTRVEIASELGVSRFKVARMLEQAVELGIVTITITAPASIDLTLSTALRQRFGLMRALAVASPDPEPSTIRRSLARAAAELLTEIIQEGDVLGVTAGRTLGEMSRLIGTLPRCDIAQLAGVAGNVQEDGIEITRRLRQASGGHAMPIIAPLLLQDAATRESLSRNPQIREAIRNFSRVTKAFVAIGSWNPADSQLYDSAALMAEAERMLDLGVQTEICGTLLRSDGSMVTGYDDRMLAISTETLRAVPEVIAVAGGSTKTLSIFAALRSGLLTSLVTDSDTAKKLLMLADAEVRDGSGD